MRGFVRSIAGKVVWGILLGSIVSFQVALAQAPLPEFQDAEKQVIYDRLIRELRCLVCQNQNLMDSNAELAADLRKKTHEMVQQGLDYPQVVDFMVNRYGNFVLYRPPVNPATFALWGLPFAGLVLVVFLVTRYIRRQAAMSRAALTDEALQRANQLLDDSDSEP